MKILFIHNKYQFKGGEDTTLEMEASLLRSKDHTVQILEFNNDQLGSLSSKITSGIRAFYNLQSAKQLKQVIAEFAPDVIHIHNLFFRASPSILYAAKKMRIPVVMTVQNYRFLCANALLLREQKVCELCVHKTFPLDGIRHKCYRSSYLESALVTSITGIHKLLHTWHQKVDLYISPSSFLKSKLQHSSARFPDEKVVVKPNFIHDLQMDETSREDYFLFVGRTSEEKGIQTLLSAFAANPHLKLVIAGDGPLKNNVIAQAAQSPNIKYLGLQTKEQVLSLMRKCKALLFTSIWYEGLPLTIIEAFSVGTPIIASKLGAMTEMIEDGHNGYHFEAGDANDLVQKIQKLLNDEVPYHEFSANARNSYLKKYHPEVHYASIIRIYQNAITNSRTVHV